MRCVKCEHDMEGGYSLRLHFAGTIRIEKMEIKKDSMQPKVYICPNCGNVEICVEPSAMKKEAKTKRGRSPLFVFKLLEFSSGLYNKCEVFLKLLGV